MHSGREFVRDARVANFTYTSVQDCDSGYDFYAPQTFLDGKGRRIVIAWMDNWASKTWPTKARCWCGAMTFPRVLSLLAGGTVTMQPVAELQTIRRKHRHVAAGKLSDANFSAVRGECLELAASFDLARTTAQEFGFRVRCSADGREETRVYYSRSEGKLLVDRSKSGAGDGGVYGAKLGLDGKSTLSVQILIDRSSVEVFAEDGRVAITNRIYPDAQSVGVGGFANGGDAYLKSFDAWELGA
jgi:beta-fructofuranosidase